ncbi:MAG TPA: hypothetical protein VJX30_03020 [Terriglobales bacterium]|nr:hypothetical protein [Terriglobales bacterium]
MAKSAYELLLDLLNDKPEIKTAVQATLTANPRLIAEDKFMTDLFGIYKGVETGEPVSVIEPVPVVAPVVAAVHTPAVPSTASAAPAPVVAAPAPASDSKAILDALNGLKSTMETNFKNVVTLDKLPELGRQLRTQAIQDAHLTMKIENLHRATFGEDLDLEKVGKFIDDQKKLGTTYPDVEKAYLAMPDVSAKMQDAIVNKKVDEQVKQKLSAATVPGQTTSVALSPAMQVLAKQRAAQKTQEGSSLERAIAELAKRDQGRDGATVQ